MAITLAVVVLHCPHCGGSLQVSAFEPNETNQPCTAAPEAPPCTLGTVSTKYVRTYPSPTLPFEDTLPAPAGQTAKAGLLWKRAQAIAHRAIESCTDESDQTEAFKTYCAEQQLDYGERGPDGRPLYVRAMEFVRFQRQRREERRRR